MTSIKQPFSVILLGYVLSKDRDHVLMLYHNAQTSNPSYGKYNGINGDLSPEESLTEGMTRIIKEETGCLPVGMRYRGNIHWAKFGRNQESLLGHIFVIQGLDGKPPAHCPHGQLQWIPIDEILNGDKPIWSGDEHFLPLVFDLDPRPFHGFMPYEHGVPRNWSFDRTE